MTQYSVEIKKTKLHFDGDGLFATKNFKNKDIICDYNADLELNDVVDKTGEYLFRINSEWTMNAKRKLNCMGRYMNDPIFEKKINAKIIANSKIQKRNIHIIANAFGLNDNITPSMISESIKKYAKPSESVCVMNMTERDVSDVFSHEVWTI